MTLQGKIMLGAAALAASAFLALLLVNASLRARLSEAQTRVVTLKVGNETLKASLAAQNDALAAMRKDSEARARKAEALVAEGRRKAEALRREADRLARREPSDADECAAARTLMGEYLEERQRAGRGSGRR